MLSRTLCCPRRQRQRGAIIVTTALLLLFLLGFMGIALDFGRLFVVKSELQTALDSCSLAAAQELDGASDALSRATSAGLTAGNLNRIHFQSEVAGIAAADVTFSDSLTGSYSQTFSPAGNAKYAKCLHAKTGLVPWLLQAMGAFSGDASMGASKTVGAVAVATRAPSQSNCAVPVGVCHEAGASTAPWGFTRGEWLQGVIDHPNQSGTENFASGQFHWVDFTGSGGGGREIKDLLTQSGQCALPGLNTTVSKSGKTNGAVAAWNTRFGIYDGSYKSSGEETIIPDLTGYSWYATTEAQAIAQHGRYDNPGAGFIEKRKVFAPYQGDKNIDGLDTKTNNPPDTDYSAGGNRRVVTTAVVDCSDMTLKGFACMLMLHPLEKNSSKDAKMWLEFISDASASSNNPCATAGLAGGAGGPRVPVLVQ